MHDSQLLQAYGREIGLVGNSAGRTVEAYLREVGGLCTHLSACGRSLATATRDDIIDYKTKLVGARLATGVSVALAAIRSFYRTATSMGLLTVNPVPDLLAIKVRRSEPHSVPTAEQFLAMRAGTSTPRRVRPNSVDAQTRMALIETLAGTGLRIRAALTLKPHHCHLVGDRPYILVDPADMSCKGKRAGEVPVTPYAARVLSAFIAEKKIEADRPVFVISYSMALKILRQASPPGLKLTPHSLRHFYCSMVYFRNMDGGAHDLCWVRDAAGHSNVSVTDTYTRMVRRVCRDEVAWRRWAHGQ